MDIVRKGLAFLLGCVFVGTAVFALFFVSLAGVLTDRETMKEIVSGADEWVLENVPAFTAEMIQQQALQLGLPAIDVDEAAIQEVVQLLIPPTWADEQTEAIVDALYDFLDSGDVGAATVVLDITPFLTQLRGDAGLQLVTVLLDNLPTCTQSTADLIWGMLADSVEVPRCLPQEVDRQAFAANMHTAVVQTIDQNPQLLAQAGRFEVNLLTNEANQVSPEQQAQLQQMYQLYQTAQKFAWMMWLIPLFSLFFMLLLAARSLRSFFLWLGWPLAVAGLLTIGGVLILPFLLSSFVQTAVTSADLQEWALPMADLVQGTVQAMTQIWLTTVFWQAGMMMMTGVISLVVGFVVGMDRGVVNR